MRMSKTVAVATEPEANGLRVNAVSLGPTKRKVNAFASSEAGSPGPSASRCWVPMGRAGMFASAPTGALPSFGEMGCSHKASHP